MMDDLYREMILEHYKNPIHKGELEEINHSFEDENPLCGDFIHMDLEVDENGIITNAVFSGHGCAISQASADILLEDIIGKKVEEVQHFDSQYVIDLLGIELGPVRLKCALLPLKVMKAALYGIEKEEE
ncbi:MAG: SUF system FeS assembly protein [Anaerolinea thermophila]|uniref:SUF system FeS assembly protein n=1 Tax=Anaerolinea thermophila TaxID=167964 RepID=A0A101FZ61_9CHLR|nr:MAG: SUF system FeS assembly protein [Anaerolinea thermophila]